MKQHWEKLDAYIIGRPIRERGIIAVLVLAMIWVLFQLLFIDGIEKKHEAFKKRIEKAESEIKKYSAQETVLAKAITNDPNAPKKIEIIRMEERLQALDTNLETLSVGLISAEKLPQALQDVLLSLGGLKLIGMQTQAPTQLVLQSAEQEVEVTNEEASGDNELQGLRDQLLPPINGALPEQEENLGVYKHSVIVALEGRYFDVVNYLQALEQLPWKIYWQRLDYEVENYPSARVTIEVYTLSTEPGVLGV